MKGRQYYVSEIEVACRALEAMGQTWSGLGDEPEKAGKAALRIIATGLAEIEAAHAAGNEEAKP